MLNVKSREPAMKDPDRHLIMGFDTGFQPRDPNGTGPRQNEVLSYQLCDH